MLLGLLGLSVGSALIPLAPSGAILIGAIFLVGQQVIGDSTGTIYGILETSLTQSIVDGRVLGRVNATVELFTTLLALVGSIGERHHRRAVRASRGPGGRGPGRRDSDRLHLVLPHPDDADATGPRPGSVDAGGVTAHRVAATLPPMADPPDALATEPKRRAPHPRNTLNELTGEEWLYFTKSLWTTAYPSELGHRLRKEHGANKPPRLMARLIEFFTKSGELVLDPFAGVGGTLLGAAIARGPRRALGIELSPVWAEVYRRVVEEALATDPPALLADLGPSDPGGARSFDPSGSEMRVGDSLTHPADDRVGLDRFRRDGPARITSSCR